MTIGEIAIRAGVPASTLRFYEAEGVLPKPQRVSGRRCYDESVLRRLAVIEVAQRAGFTLSQIRTLMSGFSERTPPSERWRRMAAQKLPEVEELLNRAEEMRRILELGLTCSCMRLEDCALIPTEPARDPRRVDQ